MKFYRQSTVSKKTLKDILSKNTGYSEEEKKKIIEEIFEIDPDKKGHKNSVWLAKQYLLTNGDLPENLTTVLGKFNLLCKNNRIKDKELKNYKSIEDLQGVVDREAAKGISHRDELEKREKEGLKEIDQMGEFVLYLATDYKVWKNRINKKMNEENYECGWCIKDPKNWNEYSKDDYLYVEKNGQPWLVADNNSGECKDYQDDVNPENIKQCAYLLYKNGLKFSDDFKITYLFQDKNTPENIKNKILEEALVDSKYAYYLLVEKIITKEDGEIYNKVLEKAIENPGNAFWILYNKTITKEDGEIYNKVLEKLLESSDGAYQLLDKKIIKKEDGEIFKKALEKALESPNNAYSLLRDIKITKKDGEIFNKVVEKAIEKSDNAYRLLYFKTITKEDGEIFKKALKKAIEKIEYAHYLIMDKKITRSDGEIYNRAVEKAIEDSKMAYELLSKKIITKSDVSSELWEKVLSSAEKYNPYAKQKFASRGYILGKFYKISRIHIYSEKAHRK